MLKVKVLLILLVFVRLNSYSEKNVSECLQGKWKIVDNDLEEDDYRFSIFKDNKQLSILSEDNNYSYSLSFYGFLDVDTLLNYYELDLELIKDNGSFYCTYDIDEISGKAINIISLDRFYITQDCNEISFGNSKNSDGFRTDYIEYSKIKYLSNDLLYDFFRLKRIRIHKAFIYLSSNINNEKTISKMYLIKGDPIEIVEEQGDWLRIFYYPEKNGKRTGKTIEGWVKKTDVE
jgi:hypothetical protein